MTRDEAEKFINEKLWDGHGTGLEKKWVDIFTHLGMLKLEEPKCASERAVDAMFHNASYSGMITPRHAIEAISAAGLKIVEK